MQSLALYLEKFKNIGLPEKQLKEVVVSIIFDVTGARVEVSKITLNKEKGFVKIEAHPALKSELFLKKEILQKELKNRASLVKDVR